jgi:hypothetical protein
MIMSDAKERHRAQVKARVEHVLKVAQSSSMYPATRMAIEPSVDLIETAPEL